MPPLTKATAEVPISVDDRLGLDSFEAEEEPFLIVDTKLCLRCEKKPCLYVCPSQVYRWEEGKGLVYNQEGCIELGACAIVCHAYGNKALSWNYPRGGHGVGFKFG